MSEVLETSVHSDEFIPGADDEVDFCPPEEFAPEPEPPPASASLPTDLDHLRIHHIIRVQTPEEYLAMFADFEDQIEAKIIPLESYLNKVILTSEVTQLEMHAAHVEKWRHKLTRYFSLSTAFVEHGKSSRFLDLKQARDGGKKMTDVARDAYRRSLTAAYTALSLRLEGLIDDVDSRVNLCKKYVDDERAGFRHYGGRVTQ